ncbi:MAG TPA: hypothetical protein VF342_00585 [Alphaproteobacteria bacterium]
MIRESQVAVVARNETWRGRSATEPYEAGWAGEAVIFVRALKQPKGPLPEARVEISPDGIRWVPEGTSFPLPAEADGITFARVRHFGNWLRIAADLSDGAEIVVLVTIHLKA